MNEKQKLDKFTLLIWMFEAQYNIASQLEGKVFIEAHFIFKGIWDKMKELSKWFSKAYTSLEQAKDMKAETAFDDMAESGEAIIAFCEKYMEAERKGKVKHFMKHLNKWN